MVVLNNPKSEASHAQELAKEKRRAAAADFLGRPKPFDKWVVEALPAQASRAMPMNTKR
jgi:hypothetical protein